MKKLFVLGCIFAGLASAPAQDSFQFAANLTLIEPFPPFEVPHSGLGLFTLTGNTFRSHIRATPYGSWATSRILGSADGPALFDLTFTGCTAPIETNLGYCSFVGSVELTDPMIADLLANRWYVTATWVHETSDIYLQGQIVLVPEPSTLTFIGIAGGLMAFARFAFGCDRDLPCLHR